MKERGEKICLVTAYDYTSARLLDDAGVPVLLVGDSLGMVVLGHSSTIPVTLDDMIHHGRAVTRGTRLALVVIDLPFMTYNVNVEQALTSAARVIQETYAQAVKIEGGEPVAPAVERLVQCGIPVMGHLGLTPQAIHQLGGFRAQGRSAVAAKALLADALLLQEAGAFAIVLEAVPPEVARIITQRLRIPTIGIGAGPHCDGQVQVFHDIFGLFSDFLPKHTKRFAEVGDVIAQATARYMAEVRSGTFPTAAHAPRMDPSELAALEAHLGVPAEAPS
ncbi:MAG: 3-methyl-2-oxobutanoate hydroxymethyltransferase, partial [Chloroflexi bacterium]|nr:3-methyl-2-oxobutanoate hydroxymethyltransferase [Chloroflexota bacterium]